MLFRPAAEIDLIPGLRLSQPPESGGAGAGSLAELPSSDDLFGALDSILTEKDDDRPIFRDDAGIALSAPLPPRESDLEINYRGRKVLIGVPLDPDDAVDAIESIFSELEDHLDLDPGRSKVLSPPTPPTDRQIALWIGSDHDVDMPMPDRSDPLLERLAMKITGASARFGRLLRPDWGERLEMLVEYSEKLRTQSDPLIRRMVDAFLREPLRTLRDALTSVRDPDWRLVDEEIENLIDRGMDRMAGPIGHWDRSCSWPAGLQLLQAAALGCRAMAGERAVWTEYSLIRRQLNKPTYSYLREHIALLDMFNFPASVRGNATPNPDESTASGLRLGEQPHLATGNAPAAPSLDDDPRASEVATEEVSITDAPTEEAPRIATSELDAEEDSGSFDPKREPSDPTPLLT